MSKQISVFFAAVASVFLASCGQGDVLYVDKAIINVSPVDNNPSSGYLEIHGGRQDVSLVSVTSDDVIRMEMHETVDENGIARMQPVKSVPIPAGGTVKFEPGGKHLMIWGIGGGSVAQGRLKMTFIFSNDDRIEYDAVVRKMGKAGASADKADSEE